METEMGRLIGSYWGSGTGFETWRFSQWETLRAGRVTVNTVKSRDSERNRTQRPKKKKKDLQFTSFLLLSLYFRIKKTVLSTHIMMSFTAGEYNKTTLAIYTEQCTLYNVHWYQAGRTLMLSNLGHGDHSIVEVYPIARNKVKIPGVEKWGFKQRANFKKNNPKLCRFLLT